MEDKITREEIGKSVQKACGLLDICIYNTREHKHGIITDYCFSKLGVYFQAFYSGTDNNRYVFHDDFLNGTIKFVLFNKYEVDIYCFEKSMNETIKTMNKKLEEGIKEYFGKDFSEDMIMWIDYDERQESIRRYEEEGRNDVIYKFYIENLTNRRKYRIMSEAESIIRNNEVAYLYMLLSGYDDMLREKYGESKQNNNLPFWGYSRVLFNEKDILIDKDDIYG